MFAKDISNITSKADGAIVISSSQYLKSTSHSSDTLKREWASIVRYLNVKLWKKYIKNLMNYLTWENHSFEIYVY